ncbi:D-inositol-3-phosphate glycosyltransferase [subsurface metagenome]
MKICYATDHLPGYHRIWGGAEQACYRLAKLLTRNGHELAVLSTKPLKKPEEDFDFFQIPVFEDLLPQRARYLIRQIKTAFIPYDPISHIFCHRLLKRIKPDVLHLHNFYSLSLALVWSAHRLGIPMVCSIYDYGAICPMGHLWLLKDYATYEGTPCRKFHGPHCFDCLSSYRKPGPFLRFLLFPLLSLRKRVYDFFLRRIDCFAVLSPSNATVLMEYGIEEEKTFVIPIPLSDKIEAQPVEQDSILYVGWIQPRKGPHIVVEAMPQILNRIPNAKLYLIGEQRSNKEYQRRMAALLNRQGLEGHVFLLGRRPYHEVRDFMQKANVVVIPEQWETIPPNALTESLVLGKALVASRIGGVLDFIRDGENGLMAGASEPADFAEKIVSILEDEALMERLCKGAAATGHDLFSEDSVYRRLLNLYHSVQGAKNPAHM